MTVSSIRKSMTSASGPRGGFGFVGLAMESDDHDRLLMLDDIGTRAMSNLNLKNLGFENMLCLTRVLDPRR